MPARSNERSERLTDRQFETLRRVQPDRLAPNRGGSQYHYEEYATAVVDPDGNPIVSPVEQLLLELIIEVRALRQGMILAEFAQALPDDFDVGE